MDQEYFNSVISDLQPSYPDLALVSTLKSGKEANVYVVKSGDKLMALKIYRKNTKFSTRLAYIDTAGMKSRERKAIMHHTQKGAQLTQELWTDKEYHALIRLHKQGAYVPEPYESTDNAILMEYIGTQDNPAPRLVDVEMSKEQALDVFDKILHNIDIMMVNGIVHGDLSAYNILLWEDNPVIIDFPQITELKDSANSYNILLNDLTNLYSYFSKYLEEDVLQDLYKFARR